ncbi:hypothetical protein [Streptomyces violascens]|uniref:hypothetical protein n=1 Tax=Streptomyces violascens TaxID=67381 RepID=UPI00167A5FFA|nr:hypothetical protein [Streptomyces violascens]GGU49786.1 hypothetical protein GCM10010289_82820 [Streptomyces violascens]
MIRLARHLRTIRQDPKQTDSDVIAAEERADAAEHRADEADELNEEQGRQLAELRTHLARLAEDYVDLGEAYAAKSRELINTRWGRDVLLRLLLAELDITGTDTDRPTVTAP